MYTDTRLKPLVEVEEHDLGKKCSRIGGPALQREEQGGHKAHNNQKTKGGTKKTTRNKKVKINRPRTKPKCAVSLI